MRSRIWNLLREHLGLSLKCGSVLFLFLVSVLVAACGASNTTQVPATPAVTVTINLNQTFSSPTPPLPPYSCGAWATQTTPAYSPNGIEEIYAKYVKNVNGNPEGVGGATGVATVQWPTSSSQTFQETTTSDGLAVFPVPMQPDALNHVVLVSVTFTPPNGGNTCTVSQPAFFTAIYASPTASPSASPSGTPSATPSCTPSPPLLPLPSPSPRPRKTPLPGC